MYMRDCDRKNIIHDGFMLCLDKYSFYIRDLNFNIITVPIESYHAMNGKYVMLVYDILLKREYLHLQFDHGFFKLEYKSAIKDFNDYKKLYQSQQSLFHYHCLNQFVYKVPNDINVMIQHTSLSNKVIESCLYIKTILLNDIATIIIPLTLELIRLDYNLYENK